MKRCPACGANLLAQTADCPVCALPDGSPARAALGGEAEQRRRQADAAEWLAHRSALRFTLGGLLAAVTAVAVLLALVKVAGPWGLALAFLAAVLQTFGQHEFVTGQVSLSKLVWVWGLGMPLLCLLFDPCLCKQDSFSAGLLLPPPPPHLRFERHAPLVYAIAGWHLSSLLWLTLVRPRSGPIAAVASGHLAAALCWLVIAIVLVTPLALCGVWMCGISAAAFTPLLAFSACDRLRLTYGVLSREMPAGWRRDAWWAGGCGCGILGPLVVAVLVYAVLARVVPALLEW